MEHVQVGDWLRRVATARAFREVLLAVSLCVVVVALPVPAGSLLVTGIALGYVLVAAASRPMHWPRAALLLFPPPVLALLALTPRDPLGRDLIPFVVFPPIGIVVALVLSRDAASRNRRARLDGLTGLLTVEGLHEVVRQRGPGQGHVACLSLHGVALTNRSFGPRGGDTVLVTVAGRLVASAGTAVLARVGGDEFAAVEPCRCSAPGREPAGPPGSAEAGGRPPEECQRAARRLGERLLAAVDEPVTVAGVPVRLRGSVGAVSAMLDAASVAGVLRQAEATRQAASERGDRLGGDERPDGGSAAPVLAELVAAIGQRGFELHYQVQAKADDRTPVAVEALLRWRHPSRGLLRPGDFLPLLEEHELLDELTPWLVETAVSQQVRSTCPPLGVAINLGAASLRRRDLVELVGSALHRHGAEPSRLTVEITETAVVEDPDQARLVLARLQDLGVRVSIDDFGVGQTSIGLLAGLPVDEVKIDRSFVARACDDSAALAVVAGVTELGHRLGLDVVAEGVEDERTLALLRGLGCDLVQGHLLAEAVPPAVLGASLGVAPDRAAGPTAAGPTEAGPDMPAGLPDPPSPGTQATGGRSYVTARPDRPASPVGLDELVAAVSGLLSAPVALVSAVDGDRQRTLAQVGLGPARHHARDWLTERVLAAAGEVVEVSDTRREPPWRRSTLALDVPSTRFYAAAAITVGDAAIGIVAVADRSVRRLTGTQRDGLRAIARLAAAEIARVQATDQTEPADLAGQAEPADQAFSGHGDLPPEAAPAVLGVAPLHDDQVGAVRDLDPR